MSWFLGDFFFINVRKNCHFWSCSISHSLVGICDIYLENRLSNFYFRFDIEKTIPVYIPTLLVMSFISNHPSFTKCYIELEYATFYHCRKWSPILFVVKNWYSILIETINKSVKSVLRYRILIYFTGNFFQCGISNYNQIMSSQHIPPNCQDFCPAFCSCLNRSVSG